MEISGKEICKLCLYKHHRAAVGVCNECNLPICRQCFWSHTGTEQFKKHTLIGEPYNADSHEVNTRENAILFKEHHQNDNFDADDVRVDKLSIRALPDNHDRDTNRVTTDLQVKRSPRFLRDYPECSKLEVKTYQKEFDEKGLIVAQKQLQKKKKKWTAIVPNSATGNSGTGKSSFINSIIGLTDKHHNSFYPGVDMGEESTTTELQEDGTTGFHRDSPKSNKLDVEMYKKEFQENGITGVKKQLHTELEKWTTIELNTAIIGNSGTGKSSFINAFRGLSAEHRLAAKVGCTETTMTKKAYQHPDNKSFLLWDLPGVGTDTFTRKHYLETIELNKYDFFILMSKGRLTENDSLLAAEIQKLNKKCFLVRSNIDTDISNDKHDHPSTHNEKKLLAKLRMESENMLRNNGMRVPQVFLINNHARDKYDFGKLNDALLDSCDGLKKDAMALSLTVLTKKIIKEKKKALESRIPVVALSIVSSQYEQKGKFKDEIKYYQKQFSIDDVSLTECKAILDLSDERIKEHEVVFDETPSGKETAVTTPTAQREAAAFWDRFFDWFTLSKENTLLYRYSEDALKNNLDILCEQACNFYNISTATEMIGTILR